MIHRFYRLIAAHLGYQIVEELKPSSLAVFKVDPEAVLKIGYYNLDPRYFIQAQNQTELLQRLSDIPGLPKLIREPEYIHIQTLKVQALVMEYVHGTVLDKDEKVTDSSEQRQLTHLVNYIHEAGFAGLDLEPENIVRSKDRLVWVDPVSQSFLKAEDSWFGLSFEKQVRKDIVKLEKLFG